ncbi:MAG: S1 RNA-binding domain-containing protein [bacterium]
MKYKNKDIIKCLVVSLEHYGFYVKTEYGDKGLVHISEISNKYISDINQYVKKGDAIYCKILENNEDVLLLSIKNINYKCYTKFNFKSNVLDFEPLKKMLPIWIEDKIGEYK